MALKQKKRIPYRLIAVEAEPIHFRMLQDHFRNNGLDIEEHLVIWGAATRRGANALFTAGHSNEWYGQAVVYRKDMRLQDWPEMEVTRVPGVALWRILESLDYVDLIDSGE